jgi:hypothetical protein
VGYKVILAGQGLGELDLQVAAWKADANPIILREALEQLHSGLQHAIPAVTSRIVETAIPMGNPLPIEGRSSILALEVGSHCLFEGPAEQHGCPGVLLLPAVEVAMIVTARAREILADLGIAVGHGCTSGAGSGVVGACASSGH